MRTARLFCFCCLFLLPWQIATANKTTDDVLAILKMCYDESKNLNEDFTPCISQKFKVMPNSLDIQVRMRFKSDIKGSNDKIPVLIVQKSGLMYYCIVTTGKTLTVNACASDQGKPLSQGQLLSIDLPDQN